MCDIQTLTKKCGDPNPPGTRARLLLIPAAELIAWPATRADGGGTELGDTMILDEAWTYTAEVGKGFWREFPIITDTGEIRDSLEGEIGGRSWNNQFLFFIGGLEADRLEFAKEIANCCFVAMIPDRRDIYRVLGRYDDPAYVESVELTTGLTSGDRRGGAYSLSWSSGAPSYIYNDANGINLTPNP